MKLSTLIAAAICALPLCPAAEPGFTELFNGKDFTGWKKVNGNGEFRIAGAEIIGFGENVKSNTFMRTEKTYKDFDFRFEMKFDDLTGNSGMMFRGLQKEGKDGRVNGYQCEHDNGKARAWTAGLYDEARRGWLFPKKGDKTAEAAFTKQGGEIIKWDDWNEIRIVCKGKHIQIWLNGVQTVDYTETDPSVETTGIIAIQIHGNSNAIVSYKDIAITELTAGNVIRPTTKLDLFDGKSLDGWTPFSPAKKQGKDIPPTDAKVWSVQDGVIHCEGKPSGYLRTNKDYADYQLHLEWRWVGKPTNSGVLLHKTGPDVLWPTSVEAQVMHENAGDFYLINLSSLFVNGKQLGPVVKPYLRAKKLEPSSENPPGEWNRYDIVCEGDSIRLTVNGVLQNKGTGAKPSSGAICLQSEGSPIQFRNIYLKPLAK